MSGRVRAADWASTPLGPLRDWTPHLKAVVAMVLDTPFPAVLWWGLNLTQIYNDAARACFDVFKDGAALGQDAAICWQDDWATFAPQIEVVVRTRSATRHQNAMIPILRNGQMEECYWTYSFTPIFGEAGSIEGILVSSAETTQRVLAERRQQALDHLRANVARCQSREQLAAQASDAAALVPGDILALAMPGRTIVAGEGTLVVVRAATVDDAAVFVFQFAISKTLTLDLPYRQFLDQFTDIVASSLQRIDADAARAIAREERDRLLIDAPVGAAVMVGDDLRYELVNAIYAMVSGRSADDMVGKPFTEVFPELEGSPVHQSFIAVYRAGAPFVGGETLVQIHRHGGELDDRYFTYNLSPLRRVDGSVYGLMVIAVDVTVQVEARTQIERLNTELNASARAKDEFLALLGHELRNPLAPIVTALELMKMRDTSTQREQALINRQVTHLIRLVDDLLDVSRITRGKVELRKRETDVLEVLGKAVEMVEPVIVGKRQHLTVDIGAIGWFVDPDRMTQVVSNLLTNASRYTPEGGHISLRASLAGSTVCIETRDDGSGISAAILPHIFEPFVQGERKLHGSVGGLGIGLALVKNLVELHGGRVSADSAGEGCGSAFTLFVPIDSGVDDAPVNPAQPTFAPADDAVTDGALDILVVDDNPDAADFLAQLLSAWGHRISVAYDPAQAISACAASPPDLAILDIGLPGMDGYQLGDRLRELPGCDALPCVALTGYGQASDRTRSVAGRFVAHLVKPVATPELRALLKTVHRSAKRHAA